MAFDDFMKKMQPVKKTTPEIVEKTFDAGNQLINVDYFDKIKDIKDLKPFLLKQTSMNIFKRGWRFQFGTSKSWAGLCDPRNEGVLKSKNKNISVVYLGDGAIEEGVFYESLNLAAVKKLPTLFICENNPYSVYSPLNVRQPKNRNIKEMVKSIGIDSFESDGNDIKKVFNACKKGTNYVRNNSKPFFLSFNNYRWREHCGPNYDNGIGYRTEKEFRDWKKRDPLLISYTLLKKLKINKKIISAIEKKQTLKIINAFRFAEKSKFPNKKELMRDVYR